MADTAPQRDKPRDTRRDTRAALDRELGRLERHLPGFASRLVAWARRPGAVLVRVPAGALLILAGFAGAILPILGVWMIPLGLALMAVDLPPLRPPLISLLAWVNRRREGEPRGSPSRR